MQISRDIQSVEGNGRRVWLSMNLNTHTGAATYYGGVEYADPDLNFDERFASKADAERWFATWSALAMPDRIRIN